MLDHQRKNRREMKVLLSQLDDLVRTGLTDSTIDEERRMLLVETAQFASDLRKALRRRPYEAVILEYAPHLMRILEHANVPITLDL